MKKLLILGGVLLAMTALGCQKPEPEPVPPATTPGKGVSSGPIQPGQGAAPQQATN